MCCCCSGDEPPTVRHLIHDLSSHWVDQDKPVTVSFLDSGGTWREAAVTGVTTTARGQSLDLKMIDAGPAR